MTQSNKTVKYVFKNWVAKKVKTHGLNNFFTTTEGYNTSCLGLIAIAGATILETLTGLILIEGILDMGRSRISKVPKK